jgi:tRNA(Arg) A34 adenosine deaminase TadA
MTATAMNLAIKEALCVEHNKWKLGSVVFRGGSVLGLGHNTKRNDPSNMEDGEHIHASVHAEVSALRSTSVTEGAKIFVARVTPGGNLALARPCKRCLKTIKDAGIRRVYYTNETGNWSVLNTNEV